MRSRAEHMALMDQVYARQRYVYDFTRKYYLFGRDRLLRQIDARPGQKLVEIGCGTARNLIELARLYPALALYGLDASTEMLQTAQQAVDRAGFSHRIRLTAGLAEDLTPAMFGLTGHFDHALFSYSLSMIPEWKQALTRASTAVGNGRIHVVDFGELQTFAPLRSLMKRWLRLFHVSPHVEILRRLESFHRQPEQEGYLRILPAHYAFIWQGSGRTVQKLAL
jgi:S-adenosylmethionine-diacylgycerolhomoserine-N-methlytransferase